MPERSLLPPGRCSRGFARVVALAAILALCSCSGGLVATEAPARSAQAESRRDHPPAEPKERLAQPKRDVPQAAQDPAFDGAATADRTAGDPEDGAPQRDRPERADGGEGQDDSAEAVAGTGAEALDEVIVGGYGEGAPPLRYPARPPAAEDLEFTAGLPEPPQQRVALPPPVWVPTPGAEAGPAPAIEDVWPNKGPASGGDRVVIRGRNFQTAQVVFGFAPAQVLSASADRLVVATPAATAGEVTIVLTNRDGNYALAVGAFRYYP